MGLCVLRRIRTDMNTRFAGRCAHIPARALSGGLWLEAGYTKKFLAKPHSKQSTPTSLEGSDFPLCLKSTSGSSVPIARSVECAPYVVD